MAVSPFFGLSAGHLWSSTKGMGGCFEAGASRCWQVVQDYRNIGPPKSATGLASSYSGAAFR
jgi:hypothetical protein